MPPACADLRERRVDAADPDERAAAALDLERERRAGRERRVARHRVRDARAEPDPRARAGGEQQLAPRLGSDVLRVAGALEAGRLGARAISCARPARRHQQPTPIAFLRAPRLRQRVLLGSRRVGYRQADGAMARDEELCSIRRAREACCCAGRRVHLSSERARRMAVGVTMSFCGRERFWLITGPDRPRVAAVRPTRASRAVAGPARSVTAVAAASRVDAEAWAGSTPPSPRARRLRLVDRGLRRPHRAARAMIPEVEPLRWIG
jgi:hypothetical protein